MMNLVVRATSKQRGALSNGLNESMIINFVDSFKEADVIKTADAFIDLMFEDDASSLTDLKKLLPKPVIINSVIYTLSETETNFIRINGWEGFLMKPVLEGCFLKDDFKKNAETILSLLGKKILWVPDQPGLISPRIISMIINEAQLAFNEGVSTKEEIDAAMKSGTHYPYGPFEWAEKIGAQKIQKLLTILGNNN